MSSSDATALLLNVCSQLNLGDVTSPPEKLTGGALHQNWKITTSNANYVIKKLNSQIAQKPGIKEKYEETEEIASKFHASGIPAVAALKLGSHFVHHVNDYFFIVYPFVEGKIISLEELQLPHAEIIGRLFANIHACQLHQNLCDAVPHYDAFENDHWISIVKRYNDPQLSSLLPTLLNWNERYHPSISRLNQETLISHRDLHCSNVLWNEYTPHVIDWESAGYTNPLQEVIGYSLEWAGIIHSQLNKELFLHLMHSYRNQVKFSNTSPKDAFFGWLGNSVMGWLEFNLRRTREDSFDEDEQKRGAEILDKTMIPCVTFVAENMPEILEAVDLWEPQQKGKT